MLMRLTLVGISIVGLLSCATGPAPKFPNELEDYYALVIQGEQVPTDFQKRVSNIEQFAFSVSTLDENSARCMHFKISSKHPVKLKYISEVPIKKCHLVGGFVPKDTQLFFSWVDDIWAWAETRKKCFK